MGCEALKPSNIVELPVADVEPRPKKVLKRDRLLGEDAKGAFDRRSQASKKVHAFESVEEIDRMVTYFLEHGMYRTACFFVMGCNLGARPSDLLNFKWGWVLNEQMEFDLAAGIAESKTDKLKVLIPNQAIQEIVELYRDSCPGEIDREGYMFVSLSNRVGHIPVEQRRCEARHRVYDIRVQPVNIRSISRDLRTASKALGLYREDRKISSYSLRSTTMNAVVGWVDGVEISEKALRLALGSELARMMGNHSNVSTTSEYYLEKDRKVLAPAIREMNLGLNAIRAFKKRGV